jgi:hypothetical protein
VGRVGRVESRGMGDLFALEQLLARYRPRHQGIRTYGGYGPVMYYVYERRYCGRTVRFQ